MASAHQASAAAFYAEKCSIGAAAMERRAAALRATLNSLRAPRESSDLDFPDHVIDMDQKAGLHSKDAEAAISALLHDFEDLAYQLRVCSR